MAAGKIVAVARVGTVVAGMARTAEVVVAAALAGTVADTADSTVLVPGSLEGSEAADADADDNRGSPL